MDEGQGEPIVCLHGEPSWSYLCRKMIPLLSAEHRVLAMDFIGFGRSDKLSEISDYSFQMHLGTLVAFVESLALEGITLVVQDWGGVRKLLSISWNSCNARQFIEQRMGPLRSDKRQAHAAKKMGIGMPGIRMPFYKVTWFL